jgi:demethylmenaquinone methyltransferase / 2-methoxy-6-polyprenyl-1,4-benzoquinol methylase
MRFFNTYLVTKIFDKIAFRYDVLNRILSFGQDLAWRNTLSKKLGKNNKVIVDIGTGTADQIVLNHKYCKNSLLIGVDRSRNMLSIGKKKTNKLGANLINGDALRLPLKNKSVDIVTISFGIRNFIDIDKALLEVSRVLKQNGKVIILEFSIPENSFIKNIYLFYLRNIVPFIGSIISRNKDAYEYLNKSIEKFPYGKEFCKIMKDIGFKKINFEKLSFGVAMIYEGEKN